MFGPTAGDRVRLADTELIHHRALRRAERAADVALIAWDAFAAGRVARGEMFAFTRLRSRTEIHRDGIPEAIDGLDLPGGSEPFGGYSYTAAAYILAPVNLESLADDLHHHLDGVTGVLASASACSGSVRGPGPRNRRARSRKYL